MRVRLADLPAARASSVVIGIGGDAAEPIGLDLSGAGGALVVAGPRRSGVTSTLHTVAFAAEAAGIPVMRVGAAIGRTRSQAETHAAGAPGSTVVGAPALRAALSAHTGPLLLLIDDLIPGSPGSPQGSGREAIDRAGIRENEDIADLLSRFCGHCEMGQYLVVGTRIEELATSFRGPIADAAAFRHGILLDASGADGLALGTRLPARSAPMPPGRGYLVQGGAATALQVAKPPV
jgi:S-DNA-T family DNA segregation ATPase FtsK/SpoIIIE